MKRLSLWMLAAVVGAWLGSAREARAQGYGLYEFGACAMAMGGAGVAGPCDEGSAVFFNPAGLALATRTVLNVGGTLIGPYGDFTSDTGVTTDLEKKWIPAPAVYLAKPIGGGRSVVGFGVMAPYGLTLEWPRNFEGRFLAYKVGLQVVYVQPTYAFKVTDRFLVGGGIDLSYAKVELHQRADLSVQRITGTPFTFANLGVPRGTDFADLTLEGDTIQAGFHVGVLARPTDRVAIGARYLSRQKVETDEGDLASEQIPTGFRLPVPLPGVPAGTPVDALLAPLFGPGGRLASQKVATALYLPDQFVAGISVRPTDRTMVNVDYQYVNWSLFDVLEIEGENGLSQRNIEDYRDSHGVRAGVEYRATDRFAVRAGLVAHTGAAPDQTVTPLLPEGKRVDFTGGFGYDVSDRVRLDVAYMYLFQPERRGRTTDGGLERPTVQLNSGVYTFRANLFAANLVWRF
jgi:long-chain fatty acid transport protein